MSDQTTHTATFPCPLCGKASQVRCADYVWPLREGGELFRYRGCEDCDLMFSSPIPSLADLAWLYTSRYDFEWFIKRRGLKRIQAGHRWSRLKTIAQANAVKGRRLLDVGGGHAWLLRAAKADGWDAHGLELLSDDLLKSAAEAEVKMHHGTLVDNDLAGEKFDVLTMWHALEHMNDPVAALAGAAKLIAPGGLCVIAVPNLHALGFQRHRERWVWCQKPFIHPWHFSAKSLKKILPENLEPLHITTRDTWDAQVIETTAAYRAAMLSIYYACRGPRKLAKILGLNPVVRWMEEAQFLGEEALRILTYAGYLAIRPTLRGSYEDALLGSELMLIARRKADC